MMVSDEEKRWLVFGVAMHKVAVPILRDFVKQGMTKQYAVLEMHCRGLTTPCSLRTLLQHQVVIDPTLKHLKFQNINNNLCLHGTNKSLYNYNVDSPVDLAKLYLPGYLVGFSGFDESLDISAILRLMGFNNPTPLFPSPNPFIPIHSLANEVRENVRNKWGHFDVTEWSEVFFSYCFAKLKALVRSLGLNNGTEMTILDQLSDWETKGCQLCMGHAVDQQLLSLVQDDVRELIEKLNKIETEQSPCQGSLANKQVASQYEDPEITETNQTRQSGHGESFVPVLEQQEMQAEAIVVAKDSPREEKQLILEKLASMEKLLRGELSLRLQRVEKNLAETGVKVKEIERENIQMKEDITSLYKGPEASKTRSFDVKSCRSTLADHYQRNAKVPTSVWSSRCNVGIHEIYTRLSWVKEEQSLSGSARPKLNHYTDLFAENKNGALPKRILVQGMPGIGKSTFVKKLALDWTELNGQEQCTEKDALRVFELAVVINLREVSRCRSLKDALRNSYIFPAEEARQVDDLLEYIAKNQENVLLVFDGYDEYRCGRNSELYQIFRGNALRSCCAMVTTRPSKADDLLEYADVRAAIIGFNKEDRILFMRRILGSEREARRLCVQLEKSNLIDEARVPILLLFFCTLWKKGKSSSFPENKTELYLAIVQCILDYSERKNSPPRFGKVDDYAEILAEIGKVALESLLEDDLLVEFHRLSEAVRCEKSAILGFLQIVEATENDRPAGIVSFIHKSIQEFLAAWYITHRCIPKGTLFENEELPRTLEGCEALDNVFQFVCGLSNKGSEMVLQHLRSVRVSDPSLDLSKTMPDLECGSNDSCRPVSAKQRRFQDLVFNSFRESYSKLELLKLCFDCTGGVILVPGELSELGIPKVEDITQVTHSGIFVFEEHSAQVLEQSLKLLSCLQIPLTITENSQFIQIGELLRKMLNVTQDQCGFTSILWFRNGQIRLFITDLFLHCDGHARVFTEISTNPVQSHLAKLSPEESCLKLLRCLRCYDHLSSQTMKDVGAMVASCERLIRIETEHTNDSICDLLEHVRNPRACCLEIGYYRGRLWLHSEGRGSCTLTSNAVVKLASLLPRFPNTNILSLRLPGCSATAVNRLVAGITHRSLKLLELNEICLTPEAAAALGRIMPEMSSLRILQLSGADGIDQQCEQLKTLFGGFKQVSPLEKIALKGFRVEGGLSSFTNTLRFFPALKVLHLKDLNMNEQDLSGLLGSLVFVPSLKMLNLKGNSLGSAVRSILQHISHLPLLQFLVISRTECLEEDWNFVAEALKKIHPKLSVS